MKRILPPALLFALLAGCHSKPTVTVTESPKSTLFNYGAESYVAARTKELQRMGGAFKDKDVAEQKAMQESRTLFGEPKVVYSSTWDQLSPQAQLNAELDKMNRDKSR